MSIKSVCTILLLPLLFFVSCRQVDDGLEKKKKVIETVIRDYESKTGDILDDEGFSDIMSFAMKSDTMVFLYNERIPDSLRVSFEDSIKYYQFAYVIDTSGFRELNMDSTHVVISWETLKNKN